MMNSMIEINTLGQSCPMPLLMLKKALKQNAKVQNPCFLLKSSDPNSRIDLKRYCDLHQLSCILIEHSEHEFHYQIQYQDQCLENQTSVSN